MNDETSERIYIDQKEAAILSDTLVQTALDTNLNVLTTFAGVQLSVLSLSGIILTMASAPEDFDENKKTLATMSETVTEALRTLTVEDMQNIKAHFDFAAQSITDKLVVH